MPITRFWGREADTVFACLPAGTEYYREDGLAYAVKLPADEVRSWIGPRDCVMVDESEDDPRMTVPIFTLRHKSLPADVKCREEFGVGFPVESARWMFIEGNYACDCNKSLFIRRNGHPDFPEMDCGDEIELVDIDVIREAVEWSVKEGKE